MSSLRIALADASVAVYPQGGGHYSWFLQYVLGLRALGHDVLWLELLFTEGDSAADREKIRIFFERAASYGLSDVCAILYYPDTAKSPALETATPFGKTARQIAEFVETADMVWDFACALRRPILDRFRHRVLVDVDPGHLQVSVNDQMDWRAHDTFLSVGRLLSRPECRVPKLGVDWKPFSPFVFLPSWPQAPDPGPNAPITSITHWTWEELWFEGRSIAASKRAAYMRYLDLPRQSGRPFLLAAYVVPDDRTGDREVLQSHGWELVFPPEVVSTPASYASFIAESRAEIQCPKPLHVELRTGWFSDRSVCYLAAGRPVLAEDTGFTESVATGEGLISFRNLEEAVAGVAQIDCDWSRHSRRAREIAEEYFGSARCLGEMLRACGY